MNHTQTQIPVLVLPERLVTVVDFNRVFRELKRLDDWLNQAALRSSGQPVAAPKTSTTLEDLAAANQISLLEADQRQALIGHMDSFGRQLPKIHMSFAVEPSAAFLGRMIIWMRSNISPNVLLEVGLQPTLAAGCTVRTINKVFDLSLRHRFVESRDLLVQSIAEVEGLAGQKTEVETPEIAQEVDSETPIETATAAAVPAAPPMDPVVEQTPQEVTVNEVQPPEPVNTAVPAEEQVKAEEVHS